MRLNPRLQLDLSSRCSLSSPPPPPFPPLFRCELEALTFIFFLFSAQSSLESVCQSVEHSAHEKKSLNMQISFFSALFYFVFTHSAVCAYFRNASKLSSPSSPPSFVYPSSKIHTVLSLQTHPFITEKAFPLWIRVILLSLQLILVLLNCGRGWPDPVGLILSFYDLIPMCVLVLILPVVFLWPFPACCVWCVCVCVCTRCTACMFQFAASNEKITKQHFAHVIFC